MHTVFTQPHVEEYSEKAHLTQMSKITSFLTFLQEPATTMGLAQRQQTNQTMVSAYIQEAVLFVPGVRTNLTQ